MRPNFPHVRPLSGLSGCHVWLASVDGTRWFVRKSAGTPAGSARLRQQSAKQRAARAMVPPLALVPEVLDEGEIEGCFYFDMSFVTATDGPTYLRRASYAEVRLFTDRICGLLTFFAEHSAFDAKPKASLFSGQFSRLCAAQRATSAIPPEVFASIAMALEPLQSMEIEPTWCHGDLTLENLLVDEAGNVWLIDLLDPPFEHVWMDVAKLHQDLEGGWYQRSHPPIAPATRSYVSRRVVQAMTALDPRYPAVHEVLVAITFARILPYVVGHERDVVLRQLHRFQLRAESGGLL